MIRYSFEIREIPGREIVDDNHRFAIGQQSLGNMRSNKAGTARDKRVF